jgi:hypothetical protein
MSTVYPHRTPEEVDKLVEVRLRRQQILTDDVEDATRLQAVVDEAAVRRALAMSSKDEAHQQLEHLRTVSKRRNVSFRIIPLEAGLHAGMLGMFTIFQFADDIDRDVVHVETHFGDRYLERRRASCSTSASSTRSRTAHSTNPHHASCSANSPPLPRRPGETMISEQDYTKSSFSAEVRA